jgi:hypothetical protein
MNTLMPQRRERGAIKVTPNDAARTLMTESAVDVARVVEVSKTLAEIWERLSAALAAGDWVGTCVALSDADRERAKLHSYAVAAVSKMETMHHVHEELCDDDTCDTAAIMEEAIARKEAH